MGFLDNVSSGFNRGVGAVNRSTKAASIRRQITDVAAKRQGLAAQLGASLYEATKNDPSFVAGREKLYEGIEALDNQRKLLEQQIAEIENEAAGDMVLRCHVCGTAVNASDSFCTGCGTPLAQIRAAHGIAYVQQPAVSPGIGVAGEQAPAMANAAMRPCPACGKSVSVEDVFCIHCGSRLDAPSAAVDRTTEHVEEIVAQPEPSVEEPQREYPPRQMSDGGMQPDAAEAQPEAVELQPEAESFSTQELVLPVDGELGESEASDSQHVRIDAVEARDGEEAPDREEASDEEGASDREDASAAGAQSPSKPKICPVCGAVLEDGFHFCGVCGSKVEQAAAALDDEPEEGVTQLLEPVSPSDGEEKTQLLEAVPPSIDDAKTQLLDAVVPSIDDAKTQLLDAVALGMDDAKTQVMTPVKPQGKTCPQCGASVEDDDVFCMSCGTKLL